MLYVAEGYDHSRPAAGHRVTLRPALECDRDLSPLVVDGRMLSASFPEAGWHAGQNFDVCFQPVSPPVPGYSRRPDGAT